MKQKLKKTRAELEKEIQQQRWAINYLKRRKNDYDYLRKIAFSMQSLVKDIRIVGRKQKMIGFPFCFEIKKGPLWFHYDCRCAAEADIIKRRIKDEWRERMRGITL